MAKSPKSRNPKIKFDKLQMYFGKPYKIDLGTVKISSGLFKEDVKKSITVYQPTIGKIVDMGEEKFFSSLNAFITNTTSYRLPLWDMGIDWNEISDFDLFLILYKSIDDDVSQLLFKLDMSNFEFYTMTLEGVETPVLYSKKDEIIIDENVYNHFSQYLQEVFQLKPEEKLTDDAVMKKWFVDKDRRQKERDEKKGIDNESNLQAIISACVNHAGFKYSLRELENVGVCEFYDSVQRLQLYESTTALMKGMYSGFVDGSKIKPDDYNFMKPL